jgi:GTPase
MTSPKTHSGIIALIGRSNAGKSTFLNALTNDYLTMISHRPQTTQKNIQIVHTVENVQYVFVDTPGMHKSQKEKNKQWNQKAEKSIIGSDAILYIHDLSRDWGEEDDMIFSFLQEQDLPCVIAANKYDIAPEEYDHRYKKLTELSSDIFPISAQNDLEFNDLSAKLASFLPESPFLYDVDTVTDQHFYDRAVDGIRHQIFLYIHNEVPYDINVVVNSIEKIQKNEKEYIEIDVSIQTKKLSQKRMIIGKDGSMLSRIKKGARMYFRKHMWPDTLINISIRVS